jgi:hypothetical protein
MLDVNHDGTMAAVGNMGRGDGDIETSTIITVSGGGFLAAPLTPLLLTVWLSLAVTAISADAGPAKTASTIATERANVLIGRSIFPPSSIVLVPCASAGALLAKTEEMQAGWPVALRSRPQALPAQSLVSQHYGDFRRAAAPA